MKDSLAKKKDRRLASLARLLMKTEGARHVVTVSVDYQSQFSLKVFPIST